MSQRPFVLEQDLPIFDQLADELDLTTWPLPECSHEEFMGSRGQEAWLADALEILDRPLPDKEGWL